MGRFFHWVAERRGLLAARLQRELEGVGGSVARVKHVAEAAQYVTRLAKEKGAEVVVRWQSDLLDTLEIDDALQAGGANVHTASPPGEAEADDRRQELRDLLARADVGLSGVDAVIAETGTLMLTAQPGPDARRVASAAGARRRRPHRPGRRHLRRRSAQRPAGRGRRCSRTSPVAFRSSPAPAAPATLSFKAHRRRARSG